MTRFEPCNSGIKTNSYANSSKMYSITFMIHSIQVNIRKRLKPERGLRLKCKWHKLTCLNIYYLIGSNNFHNRVIAKACLLHQAEVKVIWIWKHILQFGGIWRLDNTRSVSCLSCNSTRKFSQKCPIWKKEFKL